MSNNIFRFKTFSVKQDPKVFKIGTDAVLAGSLADISQAKNILDIGTGTGVISLILAHKKNNLFIVGIDSEKNAYNLAKENCENCKSSFISILHTELADYNPPMVFDYIISNPPYFRNSKYLHSIHPYARHQLKLTYESLIGHSANLISKTGTIGYIFPYEDKDYIINIAEKFKLFPKRLIKIQGIKSGKFKRLFLEFSFKKVQPIFNSFYIEETPRIKSEFYKNLTKDLYL